MVWLCKRGDGTGHYADKSRVEWFVTRSYKVKASARKEGFRCYDLEKYLGRKRRTRRRGRRRRRKAK